MLGETIGNYQIVEKLGEGGMGVVYKALDVRLNRFLALKFLAPERVTAERKRRFFQEAKAASALNHPSITHIYDIGEWQGADFIAMEYVEGTTLQQMLRKGALPVDEALRYAIQVADAMAVAHGAGIVHRDLKPGNVMVTPRGLVKILDFGLAKLNDPAPPPEAGTTPDSSDTQTIDAGHTLLGTVVGSPAYMSPEQATGKTVDARSDIFAFGALLHEMLAGEQVFRGSTRLELLSAVLHVEPPQPSAVNPDIPRELDWVVAHCLRKDPERRFQSMVEVKVALEDLRMASSSAVMPAVAMPRAGARKRRWVPWAATAAGLAVAVTLAGFLLLRYLRLASPVDNARPLEITRLTTEAGLSVDPAISADGKLLAYASDRSGEGNLDIWVKQIGGEEAIRLTRNPADDTEPGFSPDGTKIVFRSKRDGGGLYLVSTLGGEEQKIADEGRQPQFSPDGTKIAYWTGSAQPFPLREGSGHIFVFDMTTSTIRQIRPDFAAAVHPVWSPDGKSLLFVGLQNPKDLDTYDWWFTPLDGGHPVMRRVLTATLGFDPFAWQGDHVYFSQEESEGRRIGEIAVDPKTWQIQSAPRRLTSGTTDEYSPSASKTGQIVFSSISGNPDIYGLPVDSNRGKVTGGLERLTRDLGTDIVESVSADGRRLAFVSSRTGADEVWVKDLATGEERALTTGGRPKQRPQISPDGRLVAWKENNSADPQTFITPYQGGAPIRACANCGAPMGWSPDGRFLVYQKTSPRMALGLLEVATGKAFVYLKHPDLGIQGGRISRDGKWMVFSAHRSAHDFTIYVAPFNAERAPPQSEWIEVLPSGQAHPNAAWSPNGDLLYFSSERDGHACLWALRLDPVTKHPRGEPFAVQHFHLPSLPMVAPSFWNPVVLARDRVFVSLEERSGAIWMLTLAK